MPVLQTYEHDPDAELDYSVDWTAWLPDGDTIASSDWEISPSGPTISRKTVDVDGKIATCFVEGLVAGTKYRLTNRIVTTPGARRNDRSILLKTVEM